MTFEDIGRVWREQGTGDFQRRTIENLSTVRGRAQRLLDSVYRRGTWIGTATLLLFVPIAWFGVVDSPRPWLAAPGVAMLWIWLIVLLIRVRSLRAPRAETPFPVRVVVQSEVTRLQHLERFWGGRVHWTLPAFLIGEILAFEGFRPLHVPRGWVTVSFYVALFALVVYATAARRRDVRTTVRPVREELQSWLAGLESFDYDGAPEAEPRGGTA
jgi:hypothetical protein